jgi:histone acetyltransferase
MIHSINISQIKRMSKSHVVYPGLKLFAEGKVVRNALEEIPGVREAGWHQPAAGFRKGLKKQTPFQSSILGIFKQTFQHKDSWPFHEPVAETVADYLEVVRNPIDLSLIRRRVEGGMHYKDKSGFLADLRLMCNNCRLYNDKETNFYKCADGLQAFFEPMIEKLDDKVLLAATPIDLGEATNNVEIKT